MIFHIFTNNPCARISVQHHCEYVCISVHSLIFYYDFYGSMQQTKLTLLVTLWWWRWYFHLVFIACCITRLSDDVVRWRNGQTVARCCRHKPSVIGQFKCQATPTWPVIGQQRVTVDQVDTRVVGQSSTMTTFHLQTVISVITSRRKHKDQILTEISHF